MTPSISSLLQFAGVQPSLFAPNSRYLGIPTSTLATADGRTVAYMQRRFVPQPEQLAQVQQHTVDAGRTAGRDRGAVSGRSRIVLAHCGRESRDAGGGPDGSRRSSCFASACRKEFQERRMLKGINLTLMIGPAVPLPVSKSVLDALTSVEVTTRRTDPASSS